ncbi:MAG: phenylalanine--tRNA ligase subunit beta [Rickettsiales bacterium]|nr:phenylalanine--tRNA ligase subunit beta [Rickettsiales bacterium]|tara:strand:- start:61061 stop:63454 length:2394 start_codon:yes stop_codon:yes gene_type:complete
MKFTLSWLKNHLDTNHSLDDILQALTSIGLEVESCINPADALNNFVVAQITETSPHPDADKLQVCSVFDGKDTRKIVCGAANARKDLMVALALPGAVVPSNGMKIQTGKIRGVESLGMLCSEDELGLSKSKALGILELDMNAAPGTPLADHLNMNDPIIDLAITPNRADCFSVRGVARDLAAKGLGTLKPMDVPEIEGTFDSAMKIDVDHSICPYYLGREVTGLINKESPEEIKRLLRAIDIEPKSAVVDFTNFITHDIGRPSHAYDIEKLGNIISTRPAKTDESFQALNGTAYKLDKNDTVLSDGGKAIALPGIIGSESTGYSGQTKSIFLEIAYFNPIDVATMGQRHHIHTDSRVRMERSIDTAGCAFGMNYLCHLIQKHCGGKFSHVISSGNSPYLPKGITLTKDSITRRLGIEIDLDTCRSILEKLGMKVDRANEENTLSVIAPSWRPDISIKEDLIEEIARIYGYDHIQNQPLPSTNQSSCLTIKQQKKIQLSRFLPTLGFNEVISWSMIPEPVAKLFNQNNPKLKIKNPISQDLEWMRPSLLCQMIKTLENNVNRGRSKFNVFETGHVYHGLEKIDQPFHVAGLRYGSPSTLDWHNPNISADVYAVKKDIFSCLEVLGLNPTKVQISTANLPVWYHPGRSASLMLGPKVCLGHFGEIHPNIQKNFKIPNPMHAFEINCDSLPSSKEKSTNKGPLKQSKFQSFHRDLSFLVDKNIELGPIVSSMSKTNPKVIKEVILSDVYSGKGIPSDKLSITIRLVIQPINATMTEEEIRTLYDKAISLATSHPGVEFRL